jgi:hypothetical protein
VWAQKDHIIMAAEMLPLETLYPDSTADDRISKFETLKAGFAKNIGRCTNRVRQGYKFVPLNKAANMPPGIFKVAEGIDDNRPDFAVLRGQIEKAGSPDLRASLTASIDAMEKDWTTSNPLSVQPFAGLDMGLVPFDLEPDLLMLLPRWLELRGSIPRAQGVGTAVTYRRLLGITDTGTGSIADTSPFFNSETVSTTFGALSLARPPKISYAADAQTRPYVEQGRSDEVTYKQQVAGRGYIDTQALSHIAVTLSDMIAEEKALLNSRGQDANSLYVGKLASLPTVAATLATGVGSITAAAYTTHLSYFTSVGECVPISGGTVTTAGSNLGVTFTITGSTPNGALGVYLYLTTGGVTSKSGPFPCTSFVAGYTLLTLGATVTLPTTDASAYGISGGTYTAEGYDGLAAIFTDPNQSGYINRVDGTLNTTKIGVEFQTVFQNLWQTVLADPEEVLTTGVIRGRLFELVQAAGSSTAFRISYDQFNGNIGGFVSGMANQITGKMVKLDVHPYMPWGLSLVRSMTLPNLGASGITNIEEVANVVDLTLFDWPEIQMTKDVSTYKFGTLKHYAPAWCGSVIGVTDGL